MSLSKTVVLIICIQKSSADRHRETHDDEEHEDPPTPESTDLVGKTCLSFDEETKRFTKSHDLLRKRVDHVSWLTPERRILLMGGKDENEDDDTSTTTELLNDEGTSEQRFNLEFRAE